MDSDETVKMVLFSILILIIGYLEYYNNKRIKDVQTQANNALTPSSLTVTAFRKDLDSIIKYVQSVADGSLVLKSGKDSQTGKVWINSVGNVGIGTSSPAYTLHVYGQDADTNGIFVTAPGAANIPNPGTILNKCVLNFRGLNVCYDGVTTNLPTTGVGLGGSRGTPLLSIKNTGGPSAIFEQGNVGIGTSSPNTNALLDITSTTKGVKFPSMTTVQKNAITNTAGLVVFDISTSKLCVNTGAGWVDLH